MTTSSRCPRKSRPNNAERGLHPALLAGLGLGDSPNSSSMTTSPPAAWHTAMEDWQIEELALHFAGQTLLYAGWRGCRRRRKYPVGRLGKQAAYAGA